jgi:hypothetical protein
MVGAINAKRDIKSIFAPATTIEQQNFFLWIPQIQEFKLRGEKVKNALVKQQLFFHQPWIH